MHRHSRVGPVLTGLFSLLLLSSAPAFAQVGNIAGTVRDSSGGVLPGVTVEVTSPQAIEGTRTAVTNSSGQYEIASLAVGTYRVRFVLSGFRTVDRTNVQVSTDFTAPVNATMEVGGVEEVVEVVGTSVPLVDVRNARSGRCSPVMRSRSCRPPATSST